MGRKPMKLVVVPQEVSISGCKSSLMKAEPAGQERTRVPPRKGPYGAGWSEKAGRVIEPRNEYSRGKPTVSSGWKAAVLGALWRVRRTPPGSESGACLHRGNSGTWESHLSPCLRPGLGDRATTGPGVVWVLRPGHEPFGETTNERRRQGIGVASDKRSPLRGGGGSRSGA
jgi:hypothetical protein